MNNLHKIICLIVSVGVISSNVGSAQDLKGKKVLYINSYHQGYTWSDGIEKAITSTIKPSGAELKTFALDNYRQNKPEQLTKASGEAKALIDEWKPDVVIVSDDPAMKGVFAPFYKNTSTPFVFCGVNWDASSYGVPCKNITGMLEVCPVEELIVELSKLKPGKTIGFLGSDALTPRKDHEKCSTMLKTQIQGIFTKTFAEWKQGFLDLQGKVDLLIIGVNAGIADWNEAEAVKFVEGNSKIISGSWHDYLNGLSLVAFNKIPAEQGEWAAQTAIQILKGKPVSEIPLATNKKGELVINARIAKKLGVTPPFEMLQSARLIE